MESPLSVVPLKLALILGASVAYIVLGVAAAHFFRRPVEGAFWRMRLNQVTAIALALAHITTLIISRGLNRTAMAVGTACYLAGLLLFLWAQETLKRQPPYLSFSEVPPDSFEDGGPYRYVRHPIYVAYGFIWLGAPIATGNLWLLVSALWMIASYAVAATEEEALFDRTPLAARYRAYARHTGMFVPRPSFTARPTDPAESEFGRVVLWLVIAVILILTGVLVMDALWHAPLPGR
ncbi:MAG: isoprenylcysteine carboxylmethyltransferase family protein [Vicinamibacterales bacterium]